MVSSASSTKFCYHIQNFGGFSNSGFTTPHIPSVNKHKLWWPMAKAAINNCQLALFGDTEGSPVMSTFLTYLFSVHKYPGSLVSYTLPVNLSKSWREIILIASQLPQHNKGRDNSPPCPASSVKANLSSSRMFSQSWFWWTVTFRSHTVTWFWNNF